MNKSGALTLILSALFLLGCAQFPEVSKYRIEPIYDFDITAGPSKIQSNCTEGKLTVTRTLTNKSKCRVQCQPEQTPSYQPPWQCEPDLPDIIQPGKVANLNIQCTAATQSAGCADGFNYHLSLNCGCLTEDLDAIDERLSNEAKQKQMKDDGIEPGSTDGSSEAIDDGSGQTPGSSGSGDVDSRSKPGSSGSDSGSGSNSTAPGNIDGGL